MNDRIKQGKIETLKLIFSFSKMIRGRVQGIDIKLQKENFSWSILIFKGVGTVDPKLIFNINVNVHNDNKFLRLFIEKDESTGSRKLLVIKTDEQSFLKEIEPIILKELG